MSGVHSFCLDCGPNVRVDDDGCCVTCGRDAMGPALKSLALAKEASELKRRVREAVDLLERTGEPDYVLEVDDVIGALRRPLPKRGRGRKETR